MSHLVMDLWPAPDLMTGLWLASDLMTGLWPVSDLMMAALPASDLKTEPGPVSALETGLGLASAAAAAVMLPAVQSSAALELSAVQSLMAWTHYCQVKVKFPQLPHLPYTSYNSMQSFPLHKLPSEHLKKQGFQSSQLIQELQLLLKAQYQTMQNHLVPSFLLEALNTELTYCS